MPFPQGINFRATAGYVTDPAGTTYQTVATANYPFTTPQGNIVGWESAIAGGTRDRSTGVDARLAGIHYTAASATAKKYRFDLPAAGAYNVRVAMGDAGAANGAYCQLFDTDTLLSTLVTDHTSTGAAGNFYDATDTLRTSSTWPGSNAAYAATFATTIARFSIAPAAGGNYAVAHLSIEAAASGDPTGTLAATETGTDTASFSGSLLAQGSLSATEAGNDSAAITGATLAQGSLAATEAGQDTASFTGSTSTTTSGTLAATESGTDTASITGSLLAQGNLAAVESGADTAQILGAGVVASVGTMAATESGQDTAAFTGSLLAQGLMAAAELSNDTVYIAGQVYVTGVLAAVETGVDTCLITNVVARATPAGQLSFEPVNDLYSFNPSADSYTFQPSTDRLTFGVIQ